jgi:hypothetical protein
MIDMIMILNDDSLLLFEALEYEKKLHKLNFWSTLLSIIDLQINKNEKIIIIRFFDNSKNSDLEIKIKIENILLFREALLQRMNKLKIKIETQKLLKGKNFEKRFTDKDINNMTIDELINNFKNFEKLLKEKVISFYIIQTFFNITKKIVEYYSARNDPNYLIYLNEMKDILKNEDVKQIFLN